MTPTEVAEVHRLTKNELFKNDQYIDNGVKWLYNTSKGTTYFALYSTAHEDDPTVLYCSKSKEAMEDANHISGILERKGIAKDGNELRRRIADRLSVLFGNEDDRRFVDNVIATHDGLSNGIAALYNSKPRSRPRRALQNCLTSIREAQLQRADGVGDGVNSNKSQTKFQKKRNVESITTDDIAKVKSHFGTTTNFDFAVAQIGDGAVFV